MSTIEKAAARLAARHKANRKPKALDTSPIGRLESLASPAPGAAPGGLASATMVSIDIDSLLERGYLVPDAPRSRLAQEMRRIKRPLLLNVQKAHAAASLQGPADGESDPPANLIMITSALPGEGKTFTAINLAMSIAAELDRRVLLVDADVARGDIARQLHIAPGRGLSDLLQETHYLSEDGVLGTNIEGISLLLGGSHTEQVDELFASDMMKLVIRSLATIDPNRVVIFDAPPLLATTEATVLAHQVGQVVLVVEANKTPQDTVAHAIAQLEGCSNVSMVLNKTTGTSMSTYGYGYGYGADASADGEAGATSRREAR